MENWKQNFKRILMTYYRDYYCYLNVLLPSQGGDVSLTKLLFSFLCVTASSKRKIFTRIWRQMESMKKMKVFWKQLAFLEHKVAIYIHVFDDSTKLFVSKKKKGLWTTSKRVMFKYEEKHSN